MSDTEDKSIDSFKQLFEEIKQYLKLQRDYTLIKLAQKMAIFFSTIIVAFIILILSIGTLQCLLLSLAYILDPYVGGLKVSYAIIAAINILIIIGVIIFRQKIIVKPTINFLAHLFLENKNE